MRKAIAKLIIFITLFSSGVEANAGLLDKLGFFSNLSRPEIWEDQLGGYGTGGSVYARTPSSDLQIISFDPPSFDAGCGGISVSFGGFGYIKGDQLENILKNIGSNTLSYGVMLTIKSISPQIADLLENLEAMARFINSQNINSCQMGAAIAAGAFPKNEQTQRLACQIRQDGNGIGDKLSGYFTKREKCNDGEDMMNTNKGKENEALLPVEYNLVWHALKKEGSGLPVEDKEFLMSLSGTLIALKEKEKSVALHHKSSLIKSHKMLTALVFGGDMGNDFKVYSCDKEDKCLYPREVKKSWTKKDAIVNKVGDIMASLEEKILQENSGATVHLDAKEKDLISRSAIPILKIISLGAGLKGHGVKYTVEDYAQAVAFDYVIGYLDDLLDFVYKAIGNMEHAQVESETIKEFKEEIRVIKKDLYHERNKVLKNLSILLSVKQRTKQIENQVYGMFGDYREVGHGS